jgi:hypothetical protein
MALVAPSEVRDVHGITDGQKSLIKAFMQGAVYCWVMNRKDEWFAVRNLVGGENFEWSGTPLIVLYEKHIRLGKGRDAAIEQAAIDLGWLTKAVLSEDKRTFEVGDAGMARAYRWVGNEP